MKYKQYQKYKDSGIEWIGEIPEKWIISKFNYIVSKSISYGVLVPEWDDNGVPMIRSGELETIEGIERNIGKILPSLDEKFQKTRLEGDEILLTVVGSLGQTNLVPKKFAGYNVSRAVAVIRLKAKFYPKFFMYVIKSNYFQNMIEVNKIKTAQPLINIKVINKILLPIPEFSEQKQITDFIDKETTQLDNLISKSQSQINLLQEKRQALINHAVTNGLDPTVTMKDSGVEWIGEIPEHWEVRKLKFMTKKINSGITPQGGSTIYEDEGIPLLRSQNIHFDGLHLDNVAYINKEIHDEMKNSKIIENDVLLNITGASIGRCTIIPNKFGEGNVNQHVCIIRCLNMLDPYFLKHFLSSKIMQNLISSSQVGASREGLTFFEISNFLTPNPPKSEQKQISDFLDKQTAQFDELIAKSKQQINFLQEKRQALITAAVTGKIDVRNGIAA